MKKNRSSLVLATTLLLLPLATLLAQATEIRGLRNFESVLIHPGFDVVLVHGSQPAIDIIPYDLDPAQVHTFVSFGKLEVYHHNFRPPWNNRVGGRWDARVRAKVIITYTYLESIDFRGDGYLSCEDELNAEEFRLRLYGAAEVNLHWLRTGLLRAALYGDILLSIGGQAYEQLWRGYGNIRADAYELQGEFADVRVYGDSELWLDVRDHLALTVLGDGVIRYKGNPSIQRRLMIGDAALYRGSE